MVPALAMSVIFRQLRLEILSPYNRSCIFSAPTVWHSSPTSMCISVIVICISELTISQFTDTRFAGVIFVLLSHFSMPRLTDTIFQHHTSSGFRDMEKRYARKDIQMIPTRSRDEVQSWLADNHALIFRTVRPAVPETQKKMHTCARADIGIPSGVMPE